jgi:hypothetical protein
MKVGEDNFVVLQGWMLSHNLSPKELIALGLIHGFSQDGESKFLGSISYIQEWLNCSRPTAIATLKSLEDKGLIEKEQELVNGVLFNRYRVIVKGSIIFRGSKEILPLVKNLNRGSKEILPNNNIYNNISTTTPSVDNIFSSNNNISEEIEKAVERIVGWLTEDYDIRILQFSRVGLVTPDMLAKDKLEVIRDHAAKFYEQCRLDGKGDIERRGRLEVIAHFNNWIKAVTRIKKEDESRTNKIDNTMQFVLEELED